jgi:hypothetical protein
MPQQGQLWSAVAQIGKEVTTGTPVAATRKVYWRDPVLTIAQDPRPKRFATGTRDNVRGYTNGPKQVAGSLTFPMSADEMLEPLLATVQGSVTPTTPSGATLARLWTFKPSTTLDSLTVELDDGARVFQGAGIKGNQLKIDGGAMDENVVSLDLFGTDLVIVGSITGALAERVPTFLEGWQARLFLDPPGSPFGQTLISDALMSWSITFDNQLDRVYTANNTLAANRVTTGELNVNAQITFDAAAVQALTEFNRWQAGTKVGVRLEFVGPAADIEAGVNEVQTLTLTTPVGNLLPTFMGVTGAGVPSPYTAAALQTSLRAMSTIGANEVTVTGANGGPFTITFTGRWAEYDVPLITATMSTSGTAVAVQTTPGRSGRRYVQIDIPGAWTSDDLSGSNQGVRTYQMELQSVYDATLASMISINCQNNRTTAY